MKSITLRELHANTGRWVRKAVNEGEILVTDRGRTIAKIVPEMEKKSVPFFAQRKLSPQMKRLFKSGPRGVDVTELISKDREDR